MAAAAYRVALIGLGRPRSAEGWTGWGMAHPHADGYQALGDRCQIVGLCDIVEERAHLFNDEHAGGKAGVFTDYEKMLAETRPDIVSICTWPAFHAPMVETVARAGVRAIHCEKPMAPSWGEAREMARVAQENGVQLTFNHQRRFLEGFQTARKLIDDGAVGRVVRLEGACDNFLDWGTHWFNMFGYYLGDIPAKWVMAQISVDKPRSVYGVPMETQGVCVVGYENGVTATLFTGQGANDIVGCANRVIGTDGTLDISEKSPEVLLRGRGEGEMHPVELVSLAPVPTGNKSITRAIADVVDSLDTGRKSLLDVSNALITTEIIYAAYHSVQKRGRVDLPLTYDTNPLVDLINANAFPAYTPADLAAINTGGRSPHLG